MKDKSKQTEIQTHISKIFDPSRTFSCVVLLYHCTCANHTACTFKNWMVFCFVQSDKTMLRCSFLWFTITYLLLSWMYCGQGLQYGVKLCTLYEQPHVRYAREVRQDNMFMSNNRRLGSYFKNYTLVYILMIVVFFIFFYKHIIVMFRPCI